MPRPVWAPAFAGRYSYLQRVPNIVIPAQAGIQVLNALFLNHASVNLKAGFETRPYGRY